MQIVKDKVNSFFTFFILVILSLSLIACSKTSSGTRRYKHREDSAPARREVPKNVAATPCATPKFDVKSRIGNPKKYKVLGKTYYVRNSRAGYRERGLASWYGKKFHGYRTSNGEVYDMYAMTAAHKSLPLPSYVRVKNLENGRSVIVKVNDRGPFHGSRILDLSYAAAAKIGMLKTGTARIDVSMIDIKKHYKGKRNSKVKANADRTLPAVVAKAPNQEQPVVIKIAANNQTTKNQTLKSVGKKQTTKTAPQRQTLAVSQKERSPVVINLAKEQNLTVSKQEKFPVTKKQVVTISQKKQPSVATKKQILVVSKKGQAPVTVKKQILAATKKNLQAKTFKELKNTQKMQNLTQVATKDVIASAKSYNSQKK